MGSIPVAGAKKGVRTANPSPCAKRADGVRIFGAEQPPACEAMASRKIFAKGEILAKGANARSAQWAGLFALVPPVPQQAMFFAVSPQHHVQQHHRGKARDDAHGGKVGLLVALALALGDQLMHRDQDHCARRKGKGKGQ